MQLRPRYGSDPVIVLDGDPSSILEPVIRQRKRLATALAGFSDDEWSHPSRCADWSNRDVMVHLDSTNSFWTYSVSSGLDGKPSRFMASFDPVSSPAGLVRASGELRHSEVLASFVRSNQALVDLLRTLDAAGWTTLAEAPPGHIGVSEVMHHALWDSWVHERDILLPLDREVEVADDEVISCLRYAAALSPAFAVIHGHAATGTLVLDVSDPKLLATVDIGPDVTARSGVDSDADRADVTLTGDAVELLEALSMRRPLGQDVPPEHQWMVNGLAGVFDQLES